MTAESGPDDFPGIIYKYTDLNGAEKTLSNHTLKFTRAAEMNDPFDVYIGDLFGTDSKEFSDKIIAGLIDCLFSTPDFLASRFRFPLQMTQVLIERFNNSDEAGQAQMKRTLLANLSSVAPQAMQEEAQRIFNGAFDNYEIFCATTTFSNLLMWAHYADKHRGAVFGFRPDLAADSILGLLKPVLYKEKRPYLFNSAEDWLNELRMPGLERTAQISEKILYTKSPQWSYEQEWRLSIPDNPVAGASSGVREFHANELEEVYLGVRMSAEDKARIVQLAKALNPDVRILAARLAKQEYALEFDPIP